MNRHQLLDWLPSRTVRRTGRARTPRPRWRFAPTFTMLPGAGSPAIDAGSDALVPAGLTTDQRGFAPPHLQRQGRYRRRRGRGHRGPRHHQPPATTFVTGRAGTFVVTASGFTTTPAIMMSGALPAGVTFVDNGDGTATLGGIPAAGAGGIYTLTFTASNGAATATQTFTLTVNQPPAFTNENDATFTTGVFGSFTVTTSGFPAVSEIRQSGNLPAGVTFVDNGNGTATLSGTPAPGRDGVYVLTLTAINGVAPAAVQPFVLRVNQAPAFTSPRPRPSPSAPPATSA